MMECDGEGDCCCNNQDYQDNFITEEIDVKVESEDEDNGWIEHSDDDLELDQQDSHLLDQQDNDLLDQQDSDLLDQQDSHLLNEDEATNQEEQGPAFNNVNPICQGIGLPQHPPYCEQNDDSVHVKEEPGETECRFAASERRVPFGASIHGTSLHPCTSPVGVNDNQPMNVIQHHHAPITATTSSPVNQMYPPYNGTPFIPHNNGMPGPMNLRNGIPPGGNGYTYPPYSDFINHPMHTSLSYPPYGSNQFNRGLQGFPPYQNYYTNSSFPWNRMPQYQHSVNSNVRHGNVTGYGMPPYLNTSPMEIVSDDQSSQQKSGESDLMQRLYGPTMKTHRKHTCNLFPVTQNGMTGYPCQICGEFFRSNIERNYHEDEHRARDMPSIEGTQQVHPSLPVISPGGTQPFHNQVESSPIVPEKIHIPEDDAHSESQQSNVVVALNSELEPGKEMRVVTLIECDEEKDIFSDTVSDSGWNNSQNEGTGNQESFEVTNHNRENFYEGVEETNRYNISKSTNLPLNGSSSLGSYAQLLGDISEEAEGVFQCNENIPNEESAPNSGNRNDLREEDSQFGPSSSDVSGLLLLVEDENGADVSTESTLVTSKGSVQSATDLVGVKICQSVMENTASSVITEPPVARNVSVSRSAEKEAEQVSTQQSVTTSVSTAAVESAPTSTKGLTTSDNPHCSKCRFCEKSFGNLGECVRHEELSHEEQFRKQPMHGVEAGPQHKESSSSNAILENYCHDCKRQFRSISCYRMHVTMLHKRGTGKNLNTDDEETVAVSPLACKYCGKTFIRETFLKRHEAFHDGTLLHNCEVCGKHFADAKALQDHFHSKGKRCQFCHETFASMADLKSHIDEVHKPTRSLHCQFCGKGFSRREHLVSHEHAHTGLKPYKCKYCDKAYRLSWSRKLHEDKHEGIKRCVCKVCGDAFSSRAIYLKHMAVHTGSIPYQYYCQYCNKGFINHSSWTRHEQTHTGEKPFKCMYCTKCFTTKRILTDHVKRHVGQRSHRCDKCARSFYSEGDLKTHKKMHFLEKNLKCEICGKMFALKNQVKHHMQIHTEGGKFKCEVCGVTVTSSLGLKKHIQLHNKAYKCRTCYKSYDNEELLLKHEEYHLKAVNECKYCHQLFTSEGSRDRHEKALHQGIKPFKCKFCDKHFARKTHCTTHEMMHTGELPHECSICGQRFKHDRSKRRHGLKHKKSDQI